MIYFSYFTPHIENIVDYPIIARIIRCLATAGLHDRLFDAVGGERVPVLRITPPGNIAIVELVVATICFRHDAAIDRFKDHERLGAGSGDSHASGVDGMSRCAA